MIMTNKTGLKLSMESKYNGEYESDIGSIKIVRGSKEVCTLQFRIDDLVIAIDDLITNSYYRHCGYASILIEIMKGIASILKKPLLLYGLESSADFYRKVGFTSMTEPEIRKRIITVNANPKLKTYAWEKLDFIWLPESLCHKKKIEVFG